MNETLFRAINDVGKELTYLNPYVTFFTNYAVVCLAIFMIVTVIFAVRENYINNVIAMIVGGVSFIFSFVVCKFLGQFHYNEQPFAELENVNQLVFKDVNNSFPSDHTALFFSVIFAFYFYNAKYKWLLVFPFLMALSRIYVGVHYPMDVLVAGIVGVLVAYVMARFAVKNTDWLIMQYTKLLNLFKLKNNRA